MGRWYRGGAIGVEPAKPGTTDLNDLGDGMYLTDDPEVAKDYAELRAAELSTTDGVDNERVYITDINESSYRILDLTKDVRWNEFVKPVENLIRQANKNYGVTFENYVKTTTQISTSMMPFSALSIGVVGDKCASSTAAAGRLHGFRCTRKVSAVDPGDAVRAGLHASRWRGRSAYSSQDRPQHH